jgi:methyl-accepting chemotaxis protein
MVSAVELSRKNGEIEKPLQPTIRYATPIYNKDNLLKGILVLDVRANDFLKFIRNSLRPKDSFFLIDKDGYYLFHPDSKKEWGASADLNTGENFLDDFDEASFNQILANKKLLTMRQKNYIVSTIPVFLNKAQTLTLGYLVGSTSKDVVFAPAYHFRNIFLVVGVLVILLSLLLSVVLAATITKPLVYLAKGAEEMSKGKIDTAIMVNSKDEIKTLADSIERLRKSVKFLVDRAKSK